MAIKVKNKIREEIGDDKFCILIDKVHDSFNKEYMTIILLFVDCKGFVREQFFDIVNVLHTTGQILKDEICKVLGKYRLLLENCMVKVMMVLAICVVHEMDYKYYLFKNVLIHIMYIILLIVYNLF